MPLTADHLADLYDAHARSFLSYFARKVFDPEAAVDLVSETFAAAFAGRASFAGLTDDEALRWLQGIARNLLFGYYRAGAVERRGIQKLGVERRELTEPEYERIEELAELSELRRRVAYEMDALPAEDAELLRLRVIEEQSYDEIAQALAISPQNARARSSRALRALATRLKPYLPAEEATGV